MSTLRLHRPVASGWAAIASGLFLTTLAAASLSLAAEAPQGDAASASLWVRMPPGDVVPFSGAFNYDSTDTKGQPMLYVVPAGNFIAGLVAAAATHGAMANAANESKKQELRDKANKVLLPYTDILKEYRLADLMSVTLQGMKSPGAKTLSASATDPLPENIESLEFAPAFYMTQDQRSLTLDTTVQVSRGKNTAAKQIVIHMVSPASLAQNLETYWKDENGLKLREVSARMLSDSLDLALANAHDNLPGDAPLKTVRYLEGGVERFERAQPIALDCNQLLMRNLRGNLMSVPVKPGSVILATATACAELPAEAKADIKAEIGTPGIQSPAGM